MAKDIKIFVSHRIDLDSETIDNPLYVPVRCGAVYDKRENVTMLGDDTGDNISEKRNSFCELTVQYWAWKNVNAEFYGLFDYKRYLSFSDKKYKTEYSIDPEKHNNHHNEIIEKFLDNNSIQKYCLDNEKIIENYIQNNHVLVAEWCDLGRIANFRDKIFSLENYLLTLENILLAPGTINNLKRIINDNYPQMSKYANDYLKGNKYLSCNCFVMPKNIFNNYCKFFFDVLFKFEQTLEDVNTFNKNLMQTCAFVGKILLGIYIYYLENTKKYTISYLQLVCFGETNKEVTILPVQKNNNIPIILTSSNYYAPYLGVFLQSLVDTSSEKYFYDIIVLEKEISLKNKKLLKNIISQRKNIKLRFYNPQRKINDVKLYVSNPNYAYEAYYKLFLPWILVNYNKIITLDCDIILNKNIAELYEINLNNYFVAGVTDLIYQGFLNSTDKNKWTKYSKEKLKAKNPYNYLNSGVLILDLKKIREEYTFKYVIEFAQKIKLIHQEQDIFNILFNEKILYLDRTWNFGVESCPAIKYFHELAPYCSYEKYKGTKNSPSIIHYLGKPKPWEDPDIEFGENFWRVARKTDFYEIILSRLSVEHANSATYWHQQNFHTKFLNQNRKQKIKNFIKIFFPAGTERYYLLKKAYFKLRGWPINF